MQRILESLEAHIKNFTSCNLMLKYLSQQVCKGKTAMLIQRLAFILIANSLKTNQSKVSKGAFDYRYDAVEHETCVHRVGRTRGSFRKAPENGLSREFVVILAEFKRDLV